MNASRVRFAVMGTGRVTRRLIADIQSTAGATVTAIASRSADRARWQADCFGIPNAVCGYDELLRRDDFDAVYVALPPSLHHEWTLASCDAGKHVLCEKPLAVNADQVGEMIDAAETRDVRLLDATAWLHHDRTGQFRQWLDPDRTTPLSDAEDFGVSDEPDEEPTEPSFRLGPLRHLSAAVSFRSPFQNGDHRLDPDLGGGCLLDLGWYAAGLIRFAAGRLPQQVYADAVDREGVLTRVSATMQFSNDLTATLSCGFDTATRKWCEIAGEDASIVCDDFTRPWPDKPARSWVHEASGKVHSMVEPTVPTDGAPSVCHQERNMIGEFMRRIRLGRIDEAERQSHEQAWQTQRILDALAESISVGGPVKLAVASVT
ncbi:Gfo/Idh/MocA family protein [Neorhodopirellula pilleata]|uniref:1,5-anhydro-D-fructose reductase n=1 Tax=Neorhodopirellula pilleata TaxID=2714738 RepID=A0A5C6APY9_9BACT|nr:Gfo/Idh/MocA family oxidoreductase [Neorhodopirellula pilleata]TWU01780.1 1,5-anhydro-D-fructose reductase [Neorhodopirellula pilleata]